MTMKRGDLVICSRGQLGMLTEDMPKWITYKRCDYCIGAISGADIDNGCTCEKGYAFVGVHLKNGDGHKIGDPWSSREPRSVGHIDPLLGESNIGQTILCKLQSEK